MEMTQNVSWTVEYTSKFIQRFQIEAYTFSIFLAYLLPRDFYGEQIQLGMEGPFLGVDSNDSTNQVTIILMGGARPIDVSLLRMVKFKNDEKNRFFI